MGNDEFKESIEELYKFLRDKIVTMYGEFLSEEEKKKLYSFDTEKNITIDNSSRRPVEYDKETKTIIVSDGFITAEYISRIKVKNLFDIEKLRDKINNGDHNIFTEELILFSKELNIKEKDIIKSLFVQEILDMILSTDGMSIKDEAILEGSIELFAHNLGMTNGFIVSTHKNTLDVYEVALGLKDLFKEDFEKNIFSKNIEGMLVKLVEPTLVRKISKIINERAILESTQNLDEVIDSINEMVEEVNQVVIEELNGKKVIKFIDEFKKENLYEVSDVNKFIEIYNKLRVLTKIVTKEELLKNASFYNIGVSEYKEKIELTYVDEKLKEEANKINVNPEEGSYIKEAIVKIEGSENTDKVDSQEFSELNNRFTKDTNSLTEDELSRMKEYISSDSEMGKVKIGTKNRKKILGVVAIILVTIIVGIFLGWLLFKLK